MSCTSKPNLGGGPPCSRKAPNVARVWYADGALHWR